MNEAITITLPRNKKYKVYLNAGERYKQEMILAPGKNEAWKLAIDMYEGTWSVLHVELIPQLYKAFHPFQGHLVIQDYDFELVQNVAWKIAKRTGADIDIYDEDDAIVYCTHLL